MKNVFWAFVLMAGILMIGSCSKTETGVSGVSNTWNFKGNGYATITAKFIGDKLQAVDDTPVAYHTLNMLFPSVPTTNGTYQIVRYTGQPMTGSQMSISYSSYGVPGSFISTGNDNISAAVTVANGKVTVIVPNVWLISSTTSNDSSQLNASIVQNQ